MVSQVQGVGEKGKQRWQSPPEDRVRESSTLLLPVHGQSGGMGRHRIAPAPGLMWVRNPLACSDDA